MLILLATWQLHLCHLHHNKVLCHPIGVPTPYIRACTEDQLSYMPKARRVWWHCKNIGGDNE